MHDSHEKKADTKKTIPSIINSSSCLIFFLRKWNTFQSFDRFNVSQKEKDLVENQKISSENFFVDAIELFWGSTRLIDVGQQY